MDCRACAGRKSKFQMSGFTDIQFSGIFIGQFQRKGNGMAHIRHIISANHNIVSMSAPSLGITWKLNGKNLRARSLYRIIHRRDLSGSTCSGTEKSETVVFCADIHLLKKGIVNSGNHKSDGVKDCSSHEFRPGAGCADVVYIMYIHMEKSPFLG